MKVYLVSDVHTDYPANMEWWALLHDSASAELAGDLSDNVETFTSTLRCFGAKYKHCFYTPGNHCLWVRNGEEKLRNSLGKLALLEQICCDLGVHTTAQQVEGLWIVPLKSWYHSSFDKEPDIAGSLSAERVFKDFHACRWPEHFDARDTSLAQHFDQMNAESVDTVAHSLQCQSSANQNRSPVITFSHYLPFQGLLPEKRMLFVPNLAKASGSDFLLPHIQRLQPLAHCFGHTHFSWDCTTKGVRYVQWPLGYPQERARRPNAADWQPLLLWSSDSGLSSQVFAYWSHYYQHNKRDPSNVEPASWVAARTRKAR
eukprot:jgi/Astpho2/9593/e_gw1.00146.85.1_t